MTKSIEEIVQESIDKVLNTKQNRLVVETICNGNEKGAYNSKRFLARAITSEGRKAIYSAINEGIQFEPSENEKGGIIIFSTDVNAVMKSENAVVNYIKQKIATITNRINVTRKVDKIASRNNLVGWTIGHYLNGRYTAKNGKQYGENSLSVEIIGVDYDTLIRIAEELCNEFEQESVLVKDFSSGRVLFVDGN